MAIFFTTKCRGTLAANLPRRDQIISGSVRWADSKERGARPVDGVAERGERGRCGGRKVQVLRRAVLRNCGGERKDGMKVLHGARLMVGVLLCTSVVGAEGTGGAWLGECGAGCTVAVALDRCGVYAMGRGAPAPAMSLMGRYRSAAAGRETVSECEWWAGSGCSVRGAACNSHGVREKLDSDSGGSRRRMEEELDGGGLGQRGVGGVLVSRGRVVTVGWQLSRAGLTRYGDGTSAAAGRWPGFGRPEFGSEGGSGRAGGAAGWWEAGRTAAEEAAASVSGRGTQPAVTVEQENLFWQTIMNSTNPADFEAYLTQFPDGVFRLLAQNRLDMLRTPSREAVVGGRVGDLRSAAAGLSIEFGDDTGRFALDGECDDPRFEGAGMGIAGDRGRDATDCRELFASGRIAVRAGDGGDAGPRDIDFGDDTGQFALDGECDDPRFEGAGMGIAEGISDHRGRDATDCRGLRDSGRIARRPVDAGDVGRLSIDFGDDTGQFALDGECDDPRFEGAGMGLPGGNSSHRDHDATDCRVLFDSGRVTVRMVDASDFGDDSSPWANDGECDDTRFAGDARYIGIVSNDTHVRRDASDCRTLFNEGHVRLR